MLWDQDQVQVQVVVSLKDKLHISTKWLLFFIKFLQDTPLPAPRPRVAGALAAPRPLALVFMVTYYMLMNKDWLLINNKLKLKIAREVEDERNAICMHHNDH